jgi:hypothetical protein
MAGFFISGRMDGMDEPERPRPRRSHMGRLIAFTLLGVILAYAFSPWPDPEDRGQQDRLPQVVLMYAIVGAPLGAAFECCLRAKESGVRFSLGALLMAMTLIAVVVGLVVFISRY